ARHASTRQALVTDNIANADTPKFRAKDVKPFADIYEAPGAQLPRAHFVPAASRPGHTGGIELSSGNAGLPGMEALEITQIGAASTSGNTVSLEDQMVRGAEAKLNHDMALTIMRKSMDMLRATLGRRG
ncbi:MAG: hypothetical protein AAFR17_15610, partial [Pseudomonadota bacterium]